MSGCIETATLFIDGPCRLCQKSARWVNLHAKNVSVLTLQSPEAQQLLPLSVTTPPFQGVVYLGRDGKVSVGQEAIVLLGQHMSQPWRLVCRLLPKSLYKFVATRRHLWGRDSSCSAV